MRAGDQIAGAGIETSHVIGALAGLKHDLRLAIYRSLLQAGDDGMTPGDISRAFGIAPSTLSFHLKELSQSRLVTSVQEGRSITYSVNQATMNAVIRFLAEHCC